MIKINLVSERRRHYKSRESKEREKDKNIGRIVNKCIEIIPRSQGAFLY